MHPSPQGGSGDRQPLVGVFGSINLDLTVHTDHLPKPGETVLGTNLSFASGGKGANQAVAAHRAGASTRLAAMVGEDEFANRLLADLGGEGLDPEFVATIPGASGTAMITIDASGENQIVVAEGANAGLEAGAARRLIADGYLRGLDALLAPCETPLDGIHAVFADAAALGCLTLLNAAPARALPEGLLGAVDILIVNEVEATGLARLDDPEDAAAQLATVVPLVLVTRGERGTRIVSADGHTDVGTIAIDPLDTVGAGDAFCGNLTATLAGSGIRRRDLLTTAGRAVIDAAVYRANVAGALCAMKRGARNSPTMAELDEALDLAQVEARIEARPGARTR
jgi:ribokinase